MADQPSVEHRHARPGAIFAALAGVWSIAVVIGLVMLWSYANAPGTAGASQTSWPGDTTLAPADEGYTLLLFAHPQCPCTRATMTELAELMARCKDSVRAQVLFFQPATYQPDWSRTDLWTTAAKIPGVTVHRDIDGAEAKRFGAATSGHVTLYGPDGRLLYAGGITKARAHEGDNLGSDAILARVRGTDTALHAEPVYGCPIYDQQTSHQCEQASCASGN